MFTGIIQNIAEVVEVNKKDGLLSFVLLFEKALLKNLKTGNSVSVDGVCFTVSGIEGSYVSFDAMKETLQITTTGKISVGDFVNIERSAKQGIEIGGHVLSGHVEGMAEIIRIDSEGKNLVMTFSFPESWNEYIFHKGFISINGASLTVVKNDRAKNEFSVYFIPETLRVTTFAQKKVGDLVNIEIDYQTKVIVDTVKNYMKQYEFGIN